LQRSDQGVRIREKQFREHQPGDGAVEQEIVPLDGGTDRACDQRTPQLAAVLRVRQGYAGRSFSRHVALFPYTLLLLRVLVASACLWKNRT
jgi:hypothetical protein